MTSRREPDWTHITLEQWVEAMKTRRRNVTDSPIKLRKEQPTPDEHPSLVDEYLAAHTRRMENEE